MLNDLWSRMIAWAGTWVTPDWSALVALIPVLLLLVVIAFIVITAAKWANAGPTRRGPVRRTPLAPDGSPLRGPSLAPVLVAAGAFVLAFGLVAGGPALPVGIAVIVVAGAWWTVETLAPPRPVAAPESARAAGVGKADDPGTAVASGSPAPSAPARRRVTPTRVVIVGGVVLVVAVVGATSKVVPDAPGSGSGAVPPAPSSAYQATLLPADATLAAQNVAFVPTALAGPAGRPFTVAFDNRDNVPHNLEIRDSAGKSMFVGDIITGPKVVVYSLPILPAGQYPFICTVHPTTMTGTLTVK